MSSDYIPRLRRELVRAAATAPKRRSLPVAPGFRPLVAAGLCLALVVGAVGIGLEGVSDQGAVQPAGDTITQTYRVTPAGPASARETARVLRERLAAAGVAKARVSVRSGASLTVAAPAGAGEALAVVTRRGRVAVYDWELSVVGPRGTPSPADERVTGGEAAGTARSLTKAQADARAARADDGRPVHAGGGRWFALAGTPSLTNADIQSAEAATDPMADIPIVALLFTTRGQAKFTALTRRLARRGSARMLPGTGAGEANQHFAFVLDDQLLSVPFIDFQAEPNGIDGSGGAQIQGGLTPEAARQIAATLTTGPLPAELALTATDR